jgi:hypothetical protein
LQCNHEQIKKGDNSNLIDCNAITQKNQKREVIQFKIAMLSPKIKKGRQLQFNRLQCNHEQIKKGDNSNLIDCNAITQKNLKREVILQSIKLELPPFKNNNL